MLILTDLLKLLFVMQPNIRTRSYLGTFARGVAHTFRKATLDFRVHYLRQALRGESVFVFTHLPAYIQPRRI